MKLLCCAILLLGVAELASSGPAPAAGPPPTDYPRIKGRRGRRPRYNSVERWIRRDEQWTYRYKNNNPLENQAEAHGDPAAAHGADTAHAAHSAGHAAHGPSPSAAQLPNIYVIGPDNEILHVDSAAQGHAQAASHAAPSQAAPAASPQLYYILAGNGGAGSHAAPGASGYGAAAHGAAAHGAAAHGAVAHGAQDPFQGAQIYVISRNGRAESHAVPEPQPSIPAVPPQTYYLTNYQQGAIGNAGHAAQGHAASPAQYAIVQAYQPSAAQAHMGGRHSAMHGSGH